MTRQSAKSSLQANELPDEYLLGWRQDGHVGNGTYIFGMGAACSATSRNEKMQSQRRERQMVAVGERDASGACRECAQMFGGREAPSELSSSSSSLFAPAKSSALHKHG